MVAAALMKTRANVLVLIPPAQSDGAEKGIKVKMSCYIGEYLGELKASSEIERFEWLSMSDIKKVSAVDKIIYLDLSSRGLIE